MSQRKREEREKKRARPIHHSASTLSLCMIAKNEARALPACLASVKAAFDEIILVDTGSSDDTRDIAERFGARIFDFRWCDDFSAARNESIHHATGDYILWLDADDVIDPSEVEKIHHLKRVLPRQKDTAYYVVVNNRSPVDGETLFHQMRIFPNRPGVTFEGRVHEQVFYSLGRLGIRFVQTDIVIRHTGYHDTSVMAMKSERNLRILQEELKANPANLVLHYNAARTLSGMNRFHEAIVHMEKIVGSDIIRKKERQFYFEASLLLGKYYCNAQRADRAVSIYEELCRDYGRNGLLYFSLGQALFLLKDYPRAREALEKSMENPLEVSLFPLNIEGLLFYQHYTLGECYAELGEKEKAKQMFLNALRVSSKDHEKNYQALGLLTLREEKFEEATDYYRKAIQAGAATDGNYSNLGLAYRKLGLFAEAKDAFLKALEIDPERVEALTNLGHLCHETKEDSEAFIYFSKALDLDPSLIDVRLARSDILFRLGEIEALAQDCDALLKGLDLPRDRTLNNYPEMSALIGEIGDALLGKARSQVALMAYHLAFTIHPSNEVLDKIASTASSLGILDSSLQRIRAVLEVYGVRGDSGKQDRRATKG